MAPSIRSVAPVLFAFLPCVGFALACGGEVADEPASVTEIAEAVDVALVDGEAKTEATGWPEYDLWSDCKSFCDRASVHCGIAEAKEGMHCFMQCDIAAQWEGMEQPTEFSAAIREELVCTVKATDCDQVRACLSED
ncbi:MAG: hypothetical protein KC912_07865 [Proteobacteria bacterium]|nr:hypothetical protein [Pseudomonadota bacterium]